MVPTTFPRMFSQAHAVISVIHMIPVEICIHNPIYKKHGLTKANEVLRSDL